MKRDLFWVVLFSFLAGRSVAYSHALYAVIESALAVTFSYFVVQDAKKVPR